MKPARVLHILGTAEVAGTGITGMVRTLAEQLSPALFVLEACFLGKPGPWTVELNAAGVDAFEVPWSPPWDIVGAYRFWRFLRSRHVDLLHVHYGGRSVRRLARAATGAPVVMHLHARTRNDGVHEPVPLRLDDADAVIATSRAVAAVVKASRVQVVYPGVRVAATQTCRDAWTIGAAGRLVPIKGYDRLLDAFATLRTRHPQVRLQIAGEGPARFDLERRASALGLGESVDFLGWRDDLPALMARWSIFVQPSREEALGITALQAMALGLPVVASDAGGLPEIVEHGVTGIIVPSTDVPSLVEALGDLLKDPQRRTELGDAARRRAAQFTEQRFGAGIESVYRDVLRLRPEQTASASAP